MKSSKRCVKSGLKTLHQPQNAVAATREEMPKAEVLQSKLIGRDHDQMATGVYPHRKLLHERPKSVQNNALSVSFISRHRVLS